MILIIAEKPSLSRNIAEGSRDKFRKCDGYMEGTEYIITWAFGHLFSLADFEEYTPSDDGSVRWTMKNLPCYPKEFKFELRKNADKMTDTGVAKQFGIIKTLCGRKDVDTIVNAGDADREGEIIVRICIMKALEESKAKKSLLRLWLPDQTKETIYKALHEMKPESDYDNLANEGFARTYIDWLYGVNLTRYATLKTGSLLRVGRVIVPIINAVYDRDTTIKTFIPKVYYALISNAETKGESIELKSKNEFEKSDLDKAHELCEKYNSSDTVVLNVKRKKDKIAPGKLYSLTKLQNVLGSKYKMSMDKSLDIVQKLYEEGYVTYPRTNSEYLATAEKEKISNITDNIKKLRYPVEFKEGKNIFDDSKIESHSALTPTYKIPDKDKLSAEAMQVYSVIFRRFVAVFCKDDCIVNRTEIVIGVGNYEEFTLKGTVMVEKGWTKYDDYTSKDKVLPKLSKGDIIKTNFQPIEKQTNPPKHHTIETLNNYLKNPFKKDKLAENENDDDDYRAVFEGLELGTEATRTSIIENAKKSGYIQLNKDVYTVLPDGEYLIDALTRMKIYMDKYKTAELGKVLKSVYHGKMSVDESVKFAEKEISEVFIKNEMPPEIDNDDGFFGDYVGKCPTCGGDVLKSKFSYSCNKYKEGCKFKLNCMICGRVISISNARKLLETGSTYKIQGFISKNGKNFDAVLKLEGNKIIFDFN